MKAIGSLLLIVGLCAIAFGVSMDTTVATGIGDDRVHNIGLLNLRENAILIGVGLSIVGAILMATRRPPVQHVQIDQGTRPDSANRKCPFCAETIKWEAIVCRFCNRDIGPAPHAQGALTDRRGPARSHTRYQELAMAKYGISDNGAQYVFGGRGFDSLEEAIDSARIESGAA